MSRFWRPVLATGVILASWCGSVEVSEAAGRLAERLPTSKANAPKEPRERERLRDRDKNASDEATNNSRLLGLRSSGEGRLTSRPGKRKDAPAEAKAATESLDQLGGLKIDLGDAVETLDAGVSTNPPTVPPTEEESPRASTRNGRDATKDKAPRRSTTQLGTPAASTAALPQELKLFGPRTIR